MKPDLGGLRGRVTSLGDPPGWIKVECPDAPEVLAHCRVMRLRPGEVPGASVGMEGTLNYVSGASYGLWKFTPDKEKR